MKSFELALFTAHEELLLRMEAVSGDVDELAWAVLTSFDHVANIEKQTLSVLSPQKNSAALQASVKRLIAAHATHLPQLYRLGTFVESLQEGEYFAVGSPVTLDTQQRIRLSNDLLSLAGQLTAEERESFDELFAFVVANYNVYAFRGPKRHYVGEKDKAKRRCRFCGRGVPDVTFRKTAHAMSEGLGNKAVIACEECDVCNGEFGDGIERDLIAFLGLFRTFFGVKGKSGSPKLVAKGFSMERDTSDDVQIKFVADGAIGNPSAGPPDITAEMFEDVCLQDAYRALCKFVLAVIPSEQLPSLKRTISWVRKESDARELSRVRMKIEPSMFCASPELLLYVRKTDDQKVPHVIGELRFTTTVCVFVVPFSDKDDSTFVADEAFAYFWDRFQYSKGQAARGWRDWDFSDPRKKRLLFKISFEQSGL